MEERRCKVNRRLPLAANDTPRAPEVKPGTTQPIESAPAIAETNPARRRSEAETRKVLAILDEIQGEGGHE